MGVLDIRKSQSTKKHAEHTTRLVISYCITCKLTYFEIGFHMSLFWTYSLVSFLLITGLAYNPVESIIPLIPDKHYFKQNTKVSIENTL